MKKLLELLIGTALKSTPQGAIVGAVIELIQDSPKIYEEMRAFFALNDPTPDDWQAFKNRVSALEYDPGVS